jgi:Tol biopolymer transport system component
MMKTLILLSSALLLIQVSNAETDSLYFGQTPPGNKAVKFAPGIISLSDRLEYHIAFTPDGRECYFTIGENKVSYFNYKTYYTRLVGNSWTKQEEASFSVGKNTEMSSMSSDGNRLYFDRDSDIWMVKREGGSWSDAEKLPSPINSSYGDFSYSESADSTAYIYSNRPGGHCLLDIWRIPKHGEAENLDAVINSGVWIATPCVAPDGSYLIFAKPTSDYVHLYITFSKGNNQWTAPLDMNRSGAEINVLSQTSPSLSPDGKYLFFNRHDNPASGDIADIFWVSTNIIDTLKKIAMPTVSVKTTIEQNVALYPNPTKGIIAVSLGTTVKTAYLEVYNPLGILVFSKTIQSTTSATIDLTGISKGMYLVKVIADGKFYEEKIVKK